MTTVGQVLLIARRDFVQRARSKAFLASMLVIVGLVAALGPLLASQAGEPPPYDIGIVGAAPTGIEESLDATAAVFDRRVEIRQYGTMTAAEAALVDGAVDVLLVDGTELVWDEEPATQLAAIMRVGVQTVGRRQAIEELGLTTAEAERIVAPAQPSDRTLRTPDPDAEPKRIAAYTGNIVLYMSILLFGQFVMMGVMEEKSSRVVEVVLSRAAPRRLLAGKVIGIGALGLLQLVVLGGAALLVLSMADVGDVDLTGIGFGVTAAVLFWYLLGYAFFSTLYAGLGATVTRQEDLQSIAMLPALLLLPGYFISFIALDEPDALIPRVASLVPPTSPMVMPIRTITGDVPAWEVGLSVLVIVVAAYGLIRLAGRLYRGSILLIGARVRLREAWRAATR
jgi:ABC-2 type transport system permease protein